MTLEIGIVLGLLLAAVGLFATRALPVDLVTIFLLLALVLTGGGLLVYWRDRTDGERRRVRAPPPS